jgi:hypothetical protein
MPDDCGPQSLARARPYWTHTCHATADSYRKLSVTVLCGYMMIQYHHRGVCPQHGDGYVQPGADGDDQGPDAQRAAVDRWSSVGIIRCAAVYGYEVDD